MCGALGVHGTLVLYEGILTLFRGESFHVLL